MSEKSPKYHQKPEKYITESIKIEKFIPGGQAIGTLENGKKVFFWNALPGEIVTKARITKEKSHFVEAIAVDIANASERRIEPADDCYLSTSPWQMMDYDYELSQKAEILQEIYRQHGIDSPVLDCTFHTDGHDLFYRNKMEYSLYYDHDDERIHLAFHSRGSHRKVPITSSSLERREIFEAAKQIVDELNRTHADSRQYQSLLLRCSQDSRVSGGLYENHQPHPHFDPLEDRILGQTYTYSPNGFFQINLPVYEMALREMQPFIQTDAVLDLYAGVGTIGLSVAKDKHLTLVESNASAYAELERNCSGISNAEPVLAKSELVTDYIQPEQTVIVDPPRAGCDAQLLEHLNTVKPELIIYLSCNPATQARDVKILLTNYEITHTTGFNFFPRTPHLENLIILERK